MDEDGYYYYNEEDGCYYDEDGYYYYYYDDEEGEEGGRGRGWDCHNCKQKGHKFEHCPYRGIPEEPKFCNICGEEARLCDCRACRICYDESHWWKECPYRVEGFYKLTEEEYSQLQYDIEQAQLMNIEKKKKQVAEKKRRRAEDRERDLGRRGGGGDRRGGRRGGRRSPIARGRRRSRSRSRKSRDRRGSRDRERQRSRSKSKDGPGEYRRYYDDPRLAKKPKRDQSTSANVSLQKAHSEKKSKMAKKGKDSSDSDHVSE